MAYNAKVFRILIASPSDVEEEREIAVSVIHGWNDLNSFNRKIVLLPLRWETHTSPAYGARPQDIINRAIVDQCDLLIGIFWGRIGSPSGKAASGTIEEIERVGKAGKPVMLYFSRIGIDPAQINLDQLSQLNEFKRKTYPKGLVESFKSQIEFRDKFLKQLTMKIQELQDLESTGSAPLRLSFISLKDAETAGDSIKINIESPAVELPTLEDSVKKRHLKELIAYRIAESSIFPLVLSIENLTAGGFRNIYGEIDIVCDSSIAKISDQPGSLLRVFPNDSRTPMRFKQVTTWSASSYVLDLASYRRSYSTIGRFSEVEQEVHQKLTKFQSGQLVENDRGWSFTFDMDAIQPKRTRIIEPVFYVRAQKSCELNFFLNLYTDNFDYPLVLEASASLEINQKNLTIEEFIPGWEEMVKQSINEEKDEDPWAETITLIENPQP